ncbi:PQQ-dependent sugar dehydrogenase, partial [Ancylobacter sp. VNQ12]|uniref:PQQ-dependent sugar dehydrogenase n=1 Tax=Ancylobacter sp. VNQ12 TaxID=3400920 RepID=UPI003C083C24
LSPCHDQITLRPGLPPHRHLTRPRPNRDVQTESGECDFVNGLIDPATGRLWTVEHGARGGDELNHPQAGRNYGWPIIAYGREYGGGRIGEGTARPGMEQPVRYWDPSVSPSGLAFYTGSLLPGWKGSLFTGALSGQRLIRLRLDPAGERVVEEEVLLTELRERIRDVRQGPDGALWLLTDSPDGRLLRLAPAD